MRIHDFIVVGSGCSGAIVAQTLTESGMKVIMLDVGVRKDTSIKIPNSDFLSLRKTDPLQYRYFIGDEAKGVTWGKVGKGEQITPPRMHIRELVDRYIPIQSDTFSSFESLGYGGLGIGWGLQCWEYTKPDLDAAGLDYSNMEKAYNKVADIIGVSATNDDALKYTIGNLHSYQPSPTMDRNHQYLYKKYVSNKKSLSRKGITIGRTPLALITEDYDGRKKYAYRDMDFYSDNDQSAWRPWMVIDKLKKKANFTYIDRQLMVRFVEKKDWVEVHCLDVDTDKDTVFYCRKLILGTGALGSARIVLRSFRKENYKLPVLCNPYTYIPCVQPRMVGMEAESKKLGFTQLSLFLDGNKSGKEISVASIYSYQSLLLFRLVRRMPINLLDARIIMRYLSSGILIMGVHHPDIQSSNKYLQLVHDAQSPTGDKLRVEYSLSSVEEIEYKKREKTMMKALRSLGTYPLKRLNPGFGASIHYAGTLPFSVKEKPYTLHSSGRLHGTNHVFVADSSGFKYLPAQGLTFSLMANAHIVARNSINNG